MTVQFKTKLTITLDTFDSVADLKTALEYFLGDEDNASSDAGDTVQTLLDALRTAS